MDGYGEPDWLGSDLEPLGGGFSGETFLARTPEGAAAVRVYSRDPGRAAIDAALLHLVNGLLPVPRVLELRHPIGEGPGILVTEWLAGVPLDRAVDEATAVDWSALGRSIGRLLATLSGIPMSRPGLFRDADLVPDAEGMPSDLREWTEQRRDRGLLADWRDDEFRALLDLADRGQDLLDGGTGRAVLVHSDLNLKNLLVDPASWEITAILDWEFAHAGSPDADLGNLTRFEREPAFLAALAGALDRRTDPAEDRLLRARAADLWAAVELAGRPHVTTVSRLAERLLRAQARDGDLDGWPFPGRRVGVPSARLGDLDGQAVS